MTKARCFFRDLVLEAIRLKLADTPKEEIHRHLWKCAQAHGPIVESGDEDAYELRLVATGEVISFSRGAYSYRSS